MLEVAVIRSRAGAVTLAFLDVWEAPTLSSFRPISSTDSDLLLLTTGEKSAGRGVPTLDGPAIPPGTYAFVAGAGRKQREYICISEQDL